jgi:hypothetical protein
MRAQLIITLAGLVACTPIGTPNEHGSGAQRDDSTASTELGSAKDAGTDGSQDTPDAGRTPETGADCTSEGARSCAGHASRTTLMCEGGHWREHSQCEADERCDTASGAEQGRCRPIVEECLNRQPGAAYCDATQERRVCVDLVASRALACDALERCVGMGDRVHCACIPGAIDGDYGCELALHCGPENGGCDPLTQCSEQGDHRACSACPPGYAGSGETGCAPLASDIRLSSGQLTPTFDPAVYEYTVTLPFFTASLDVTVSGPADATFELNAAPAAFDTPVGLRIAADGGSHEIVLKTRFGVSSAYKIKLQRTAPVESDLLKASNASSSDHFGYALAMSKDTLAVGAIYEDATGTPDSGAVYVFTRSGDHWQQKQLLRPDRPVAAECFGAAVALSDTTLVVGALYEFPCTPVAAAHGGTAYVFERNQDGWVQTDRLTGPEGGAAGDGFGSAVAIEQDTLIVGAMFADSEARDGGAAYVFTRSGGRWTLAQTLASEQPITNGAFGTMVALQRDTLIATAFRESSAGLSEAGAAYVFTLGSSGTWERKARLQQKAPEVHGGFGFGMALLGDRLIVGAPNYDLLDNQTPRGQATLFERSAGEWRETVTLQAPNPRVGDAFGSAVGLSAHYAAVGALGDGSGLPADSPRSGSLHLFGLHGASDWQTASFIKASNADRNDNLGCAIGISDQEVVVSANGEASSGPNNPGDNSAPTSGAVYVYR